MKSEYQWVTWILVVGGWVVFILDHNRRARRAEIRKLIDEAIEISEELESASHVYWTQDEAQSTSCKLAAEIKRGLSRLVRITNALKRNDDNFSIDDKIKIFRQAMTTGEFESKKRKAVGSTDKRIEGITAAALDLTDELEKTFEALYCSSWWQKLNR